MPASLRNDCCICQKSEMSQLYIIHNSFFSKPLLSERWLARGKEEAIMESTQAWRDPIRERTRKCSGVAVTSARLIQKDGSVIFSKMSGKLKHHLVPETIQFKSIQFILYNTFYNQNYLQVLYTGRNRELEEPCKHRNKP